MGGDRTAPVVATVAGIAGLLHMAASWAHREHALLADLLLVAALLQLAWAASLVLRPRPWTIVAGAVVSLAIVAAYTLTRVTGLSDVGGLESAQPLTYGGAVTIALTLGAAGGGLLLLDPAAPARRWARLPGRQGAAVAVSVAVVASTPALVSFAATPVDRPGETLLAAGDHVHGAGADHQATDHHAADHDAGGHGDASHRSGDHEAGAHDPHDANGEHGSTGHGAQHAPGAGHAHDVHATGPDHHEHPAGHGGNGGGNDHDHDGDNGGGHDHGGGNDHDGDNGGGHDHGGGNDHGHGGGNGGGHDHGGADLPVGFPADWTDAQVTEAQALIAATEAALGQFADPDDAFARGFRWIGDGGSPGGYQHWINLDWFGDEHVLNPNFPESLIYRNTGDGLVLEAAMFFLPWGYDMGNIPSDLAWLPGWHTHDNLCFNASGRLTGLAVDGVCARGFLFIPPPMMHVWLVDTPCGRFAGVDEHGLHCDHDH